MSLLYVHLVHVESVSQFGVRNTQGSLMLYKVDIKLEVCHILPQYGKPFMQSST